MKNMKILLAALFLTLSANSLWACEEGGHHKDSASRESMVVAQADTKDQESQSKKVIIDVRTPQEYEAGHLEGAINIPHTEIGGKISSVTQEKDQAIVVYCGSGRRAGLAKEELEKLGYTHVTNAGGYKDLKGKLLP